MQKYYGLRLLRTFFIALAGIISLSAIVAPITMITNNTIDLLQALAIIAVSGIASLFLYAFAQLTDLQIKNYQASWRVLRQIAKANALNSQILEVMAIQLELMKNEYKSDDDKEVDEIIKQIKLRRERLEQEYSS